MLTVAIAVASVVPLWLTPVVPTTDGPAHLYNAWLLLHLDDPDLDARRLVEVNLLVPNWGSVGPLVPLLLVSPPAVAEKIDLSAIVALLVTGAALLAWRVRGDPVVVGASAGILAHGWLLAAGFTGFLASFGLALMVCALGMPLVTAPGGRRHRWATLALATAFALLFFVHLAGAVFAVAFWVLLCVGRWRGGLPARRALTRALVPLVPLALLLAVHGARGSERSRPEFRTGPAPGWSRLAELPTGLYWEAYAVSDRRIGMALVLLSLGLLAARATRPRGNGKAGFGEDDGAEGGGGRWLAIGAAGALLAFVVMPWAAGGGAFLTDRLVLAALLLPLPWASSAGLPARGLFRAGLVILLVGALAQRAAQYRLWGRVVSAVVERNGHLPEGRILVQPQAPPVAMAVNPLHHVWGRVGIDRRAFALDNYEAAMVGWFPVSFRPEAQALATAWREGGDAPRGAVILSLD